MLVILYLPSFRWSWWTLYWCGWSRCCGRHGWYSLGAQMSKGEYYNVFKVVTGLQELQGVYWRLQGCPAYKCLLETDVRQLRWVKWPPPTPIAKRGPLGADKIVKITVQQTFINWLILSLYGCFSLPWRWLPKRFDVVSIW